MRVKMATCNSAKLVGTRLSRANLGEEIYGHSSFVISITKCVRIQPIYLKQVLILKTILSLSLKCI